VSAAVRIVDAVRGVECRPAMAFQNLALAPLVADRDREAGYVVLDDALARGWVTVSEVGEGGHVPELKVVNRGDVAVLLLDGEELVGAKQNRVLNLTILVPPQHTTIIPVSCVESGRWRHVSHQFGAASRTQFAEGRAAKMHQVAIALEAMRMVEEGVASAEDIDAAMVLGYKHPTGPLKTTDIVGLDVRLGIAEYLHSTLGERFAPPRILRDKVARGELGRKSGKGFFDWSE